MKDPKERRKMRRERNLLAKELRDPKYRQRKVPKKKSDEEKKITVRNFEDFINE